MLTSVSKAIVTMHEDLSKQLAAGQREMLAALHKLGVVLQGAALDMEVKMCPPQPSSPMTPRLLYARASGRADDTLRRLAQAVHDAEPAFHRLVSIAREAETPYADVQVADAKTL